MSEIGTTLRGAPAVTERYRQAAEAGDADGAVATLSPVVVVPPPITDRVVFRGHEEVRELLSTVLTTISDIHYFADVGDERTRALFYRGTVGGQPLEEATRLELDAQGRITEITLFFRPLAGLATLTAALGPPVARGRPGRLRALLARLALAPLGAATRLGDRIITWFA